MVERLLAVLICSVVLFLIFFAIGLIYGLYTAILSICTFVAVCFLAPYAIEDPSKFGLCVILSVATVAISMLICSILRRIGADIYKEEEI